ncbi:hypothetical protein HELRODRAFT_159893 [Helobdella robusta]|uniref:Uncharacterized protein n=1 Tax=Helobdella robusta TaxID=6412 RepID=T1EPI4_HELRO|nr:hypothetical protein HELRODRAFT_159893 [Helobdella robusta]ESO05817.1 hypothetical protein HELRODRAFT_159893 [Helobdella robusta]
MAPTTTTQSVIPNNNTSTTTAVDLAWDYNTGDDTSPLLRRAAARINQSEQQKCTMTRRQVQYLIHSVHEISQILSNELYRCDHTDINNSNNTNDVNTINNNNNNITGSNAAYGCSLISNSSGGSCSQFKKRCSLFNYLIEYSVLIMFILQVPYTSCTSVIICIVLLFMHYLRLLKFYMDLKRVHLYTLCTSCFVTVVIFASLYTTIQQLQGNDSQYFIGRPTFHDNININNNNNDNNNNNNNNNIFDVPQQTNLLGDVGDSDSFIFNTTGIYGSFDNSASAYNANENNIQNPNLITFNTNDDV